MKRSPFRSLSLLALVAVLAAVVGCTQQSASSGSGGTAPAPAPAENPAPGKPADEPKEPQYKSWTVYINDEDSYSAGAVTYKIALNLTATNPSANAAGKYAGNATASTSTNGTVSGAKGSAQLDANAVANSGTLQFTLEDQTGGGALAGLSNETSSGALLGGTGTITMKAAGSGTVGPAGGSFGNTSSQQIDVQVQGSKVTLKVAISGHTYTFDGTISGKE